MPSKRLPIHRPLGSYSPELTLHEFDWANLVEGRFFEQMLVGIIGVIIGLVSVASDTIRVPELVMVDPWLSGVCIGLAFTRVWKTIREEHETAALWDSVSAENSENQVILDRVFEIPYLFTLTIMPIAAIAPQLFMVVLFVFYVCDNFYNAALARGAEKENESQSYAGAIRTAMSRIAWLKANDLDTPRRRDIVAYFLKRSHYDSAMIGLLMIGFVGVLAGLFAGERGAAWVIAFTTLGAILLFEIFIEPRRNRGMTFMPESEEPLSVVMIADVTSRAGVSDATAQELTDIHVDTFGPEEQQFTMADMLRGAGLQHPLLRIVSLDRHVIGYLFLEKVPEEGTAFLWYVAIKKEHRNGGIGAHLIRDTWRLLQEANGKIRYAFFEVHKAPEDHDATDDKARDHRRRIRFYRHLGAHWVRGVDYRIPAANNPRASVAYDPMFFSRDGNVRRHEVAQRILSMAADNFKDDPSDERWQSLQASLKELTVVEPGEKVDGF